MTGIFLISLLFCLLPATLCLQWASNIQDGQVFSACSGDSVTLPWNFNVGPGEGVTSIQWFTGQGQSQIMLAFYSHGTFVPVPDFAGRITHTTDGELIIHDVTPNDNGNYSIEVNGHDASGSSFQLVHTAVLNVSAADSLMTSDHQLHVTQSPHAVYDNVTGQILVMLYCGNFVSKDQPPFTVEWLTPSGQIHSSSAYRDGHFQFPLPSTAETGVYTCRIPDRFSGLHCLPPNLSAVGQATVQVNGLEIRLALLEAKQNSLQEENLQLKGENQGLKDRLTALENATSSVKPDNPSESATVQHLAQVVSNHTQTVENLTQIVHSHSKDVKNLTDKVEALGRSREGDMAALATLQHDLSAVNQTAVHAVASSSALAKEIHMLEVIHIRDNATHTKNVAEIRSNLTRAFSPLTDTKTVSFHAQLDTNLAVSSGHTLVLATVYNNNGDAYDNTTGIFTAPLDGTYFFIASTGSHNQSHDAYMELTAEGRPLALAYAHRSDHSSEVATLHAVTDLASGERVWLTGMLDSYFNYADTFFTGFLVSKG